MKKIGFSGTLDPITNGHMWVIGEARAIADDVVVFLSENSTKQPKFSAEQRKAIIAESCAERGWDNVLVQIVKSDYTARVAKKHGIDYLMRGIRTTSDFDYENLIQQTNVDVIGGAKTLFVMPPRDLGSVSSSFVKALEGPVGWNWTMKNFVPGPAYRAWIISWLRKEWDAMWQGTASDAAAGGNPVNANQWFERLTGATAYGGAERHYHNLDHLVHGLAEIRSWSANTGASRRDADTVRAAFWFHDAVYEHGEAGGSANPGGSANAGGTGGNGAAGNAASATGAASAAVSNEEASARLWLASGLGPEMAEDVAALIRATDHFQSAAVAHPLKDTMLSVDLAILGQSSDVYRHYTEGIRAEYRHVSADRYALQRGQVLTYLRHKAEAGTLFGDPYLSAQYNAQAIANMSEEIAGL